MISNVQIQTILVRWHGVNEADTAPSADLTQDTSRLGQDSKISATFLDQVIAFKDHVLVVATTLQNVFRMLLYGQSHCLPNRAQQPLTIILHLTKAKNESMSDLPICLSSKSHDEKKKGIKNIFVKESRRVKVEDLSSRDVVVGYVSLNSWMNLLATAFCLA